MGSRVTLVEPIVGHFVIGLPESLLSHSWVTLLLFVFLCSGGARHLTSLEGMFRFCACIFALYI